MKITKSKLKQLIKEEYSSLTEFNWDEGPGSDPGKEPGGPGMEPRDPDMSTGWKLDRILEILGKAFPNL